MPRTVKLPNGQIYNNVPDHISDEQLLQMDQAKNEPTPVEQVAEPEPTVDSVQDTAPPPQVEPDPSVATDLQRVIMNSAQGPSRLITDIYKQFNPESSEKIDWAMKEATRVMSEAFFMSPEEIMDEKGKVKPTETWTGMGASMVPYVVGGSLVTKSGDAIKETAIKAFGAGLVADQLYTDPDQNIFTAWNEMVPESFTNGFTDFMAASESDQPLTKRGKLLLEGLGIGGIMSALFSMPKVIKESVKKFGKPPKELTPTQMNDLAENVLRDAHAPNSLEDPKAIIDKDTGKIRFKTPEERTKFYEEPQGVDQVIRQNSSALKRFTQQYMTSRGYYTPKAYDAFNDSEYAKRASIAAAEHISNRLNTAIKDIVAVAPDSKIAEYTQMALVDPELIGALPPEVGIEVMRSRLLIDNMSKKLMNSDVISPTMRETIAHNMGTYLRRSYRLYEDAGYQPAPQDRSNAIDFLTKQILGKDPTRDYGQAVEAAEAAVKEILGEDHGDTVKYFTSARAVNKYILKQRKDIPPEIRKLMGEIEEPTENVVLSVSKVAQLYENHRFYDNLHKLGKGKYIFRPEEVPSGDIFTAKITGTNTKLDGMFTTPEIVTALKNQESRWFDLASESPGAQFYKNFLALKGASQASKTVYSHVTHLRNFLGGMQFGVANGANPFVGDSHGIFNTLANQIKLGGDDVLDSTYEKLLRLGIINTNVRVNEFRELLDVGANTTTEGWLDKLSELGARYGIREEWQRLPGEAYMATDDFFKISSFVNEVDWLQRAFPNQPQDLLEKQAARIVRDTFPNYDKVPKGLKRLRELPLGNFVAFPAEITRNSWNIVAQASREITSGNPILAQRGRARLTGFIGSGAAWYGMAKGTESLLGWNDDEAKAANTLTETPWSEDSPRNWVKIGDEVFVNDIQFLDSYSYIKEPVIAAYDEILSGRLEGKALDEYLLKASTRGLEKLLTPFVSPSIFTDALLNLGFAIQSDDGRDTQGKAIVTPGMPASEQFAEGFSTIASAFIPGSLNSGADLVEAYRGVVNKNTGKADSAGAELVTNLTGVRFKRFDPADALMFSVKNYVGDLRNVRGLQINYESTPGDIRRNYQERERERYRYQQELYKKVDAASHFLPTEDIIQILTDNGVGEEQAIQIMEGYFAPSMPTDQDIIDIFMETYAEGRHDLSSFEVTQEEISQQLFEMYSDMVMTSLVTFEDDEQVYEDYKASQDGVRLLKASGGIVDIPNAPADPDNRINKLTGRPYNEDAGSIIEDDTRAKFSKGGQVLKKLAPAFRKLFKEESPAAMRAIDSLAGDPINDLDLESPLTVSFMNSNNAIPLKRQETKGTFDLGNFHEILPVNSPEGKKAMKELGYSDSHGYSHIVVYNESRQSLGESPYSRETNFFMNPEEIKEYYNDGLGSNRPLWAAKHLPQDQEFSKAWRSLEDSEEYLDVLPQSKVAKANAIAKRTGADPDKISVILQSDAAKNDVSGYIEYDAQFNEDFIKMIEEKVRPVKPSIFRRVKKTPANPEKFLEGSKVSLPVFRGTTSPEPVSEALLGLENPREIGLHVSGSHGPAVMRLAPRREGGALTKEALSEKFDKVLPEEIEGAAVSQYYINIKNPLVIEDMSLWDAQDIIARMQEGRNAGPRNPFYTFKDIQENFDFELDFNSYSPDTDELIGEYINLRVRGKPEADDLAMELDMEDIDLDSLDEAIDQFSGIEGADETGFTQAIESQLGRQISAKEWKALEKIQNKTLGEVIGETSEMTEQSNPQLDLMKEMDQWDTNRKFRDWLKKLGFDSIEYENTGEGYIKGQDNRSWIIFDSKQLKSVGAESFDPQDKRIDKAKGGIVKRRGYALGGLVRLRESRPESNSQLLDYVPQGNQIALQGLQRGLERRTNELLQ